ncbi:Hypothetical predicted protein, partial [Olea europaea subsp. europaea]
TKRIAISSDFDIHSGDEGEGDEDDEEEGSVAEAGVAKEDLKLEINDRKA